MCACEVLCLKISRFVLILLQANAVLTFHTQNLMVYIWIWENSGSVVECLTRDRGAAGLSLTSVTVLLP